MSEYKDIKNNTYKIEQKCILSEEERKQAEEEPIEEVYRIFAKR